MSVYCFTVPGEPVAKGRPKFTSRGGFVRAITPEKTANYETLVKLSFKQKYPDEVPVPKDTPVIVHIVAHFAIPKSVSKRKARDMQDGYIRPTKKPDCDNIAKIICDALNGIAYYDDSQIVKIEVDKVYNETPRVDVVIEYQDKRRNDLSTE